MTTLADERAPARVAGPVQGPYVSGQHMRPSDAFAWRMESDPLLRSTVVSIAVLRGSPDWERLVERIDRLTRAMPVFRDRLEESWLRLQPPTWRTDPDFDLGYHVRRMVLPEPATFEAVLERARTMAMARFDPARPMWEMLLTEGLRLPDGGEGAAVITKIHHSLADGIGGLQLATFVYDDDPDRPHPEVPDEVAPSEPATAEPVDRARWLAGLLAGTVGGVARAAVGEGAGWVRHPRSHLRGLLATSRSIGKLVAPATDTLSPVMRDRKLIWHYDVIDVELEALRSAARAGGGSVNDAFFAGVTGGLRRYHERHGAKVDRLRVTMPINLRAEDDPLGGNRITLVRFVVPVGDPDPLARMRAIGALARGWRREPSLAHTQLVAGALNALPTAVVGAMLKHVDFLASNVPGYPTPVHLAGAPVERIYGFGPTIGASLNTTLLSYAGTCCIGITTDGGAVPDRQLLKQCLLEGFAELPAG